MKKTELMESVCKQIWESIDSNIWEYFHGFNVASSFCSMVNLEDCENLPETHEGYSEYLHLYDDLNDYLKNGKDIQVVKDYVKDLYDCFCSEYEFFDYNELQKGIETSVSNKAANGICIQAVCHKTYGDYTSFCGLTLSTEQDNLGGWFFKPNYDWEFVDFEIELDSDFIEKWRNAEN